MIKNNTINFSVPEKPPVLKVKGIDVQEKPFQASADETLAADAAVKIIVEDKNDSSQSSKSAKDLDDAISIKKNTN